MSYCFYFKFADCLSKLVCLLISFDWGLETSFESKSCLDRLTELFEGSRLSLALRLAVMLFSEASRVVVPPE